MTLAEPGLGGLLAVGDRVDLLAVRAGLLEADGGAVAGRSQVVARAARVLAPPTATGPLLVAVSPAEALDLASAAADARLSFVLHP